MQWNHFEPLTSEFMKLLKIITTQIILCPFQCLFEWLSWLSKILIIISLIVKGINLYCSKIMCYYVWIKLPQYGAWGSLGLVIPWLHRWNFLMKKNKIEWERMAIMTFCYLLWSWLGLFPQSSEPFLLLVSYQRHTKGAHAGSL